MKARKAMALAMTAAMVGGLMTVPVMAEENAELLPGGGSKIIYCITPSTSNPFFNTEQVIAKEKAEELKLQVEVWMISIPFRMQRIIKYKIFEDMTWQQVADRMGRKITEASVKMEFKRFFEKN